MFAFAVQSIDLKKYGKLVPLCSRTFENAHLAHFMFVYIFPSFVVEPLESSEASKDLCGLIIRFYSNQAEKDSFGRVMSGSRRKSTIPDAYLPAETLASSPYRISGCPDFPRAALLMGWPALLMGWPALLMGWHANNNQSNPSIMMLATIWIQKVMIKCSIFNQTSDQPPASVPTKTISKNVIWMRYQKKSVQFLQHQHAFPHPQLSIF